MIIRKHNLPLVQQCRALKIHRTTIYREPKPVNQDQLELIKLIDSIHIESPEWGCRKVRDRLIALGHPIGRRHCNTLFRKLGIHWVYRKPRTTNRAQDIPVPPKTLGNRQAKQCLVDGLHEYPDGEGLCVPDMRHGYLQQKDVVQCHFKHPGCKFLC